MARRLTRVSVAHRLWRLQYRPVVRLNSAAWPRGPPPPLQAGDPPPASPPAPPPTITLAAAIAQVPVCRDHTLQPLHSIRKGAAPRNPPLLPPTAAVELSSRPTPVRPRLPGNGELGEELRQVHLPPPPHRRRSLERHGWGRL